MGIKRRGRRRSKIVVTSLNLLFLLSAKEINSFPFPLQMHALWIIGIISISTHW